MRPPFDLGSRKIPHTAEQLSHSYWACAREPGAAATEPMCCSHWSLHPPEPALRSKRCHCKRGPSTHLESSPCSPRLEKRPQQPRLSTAQNKIQSNDELGFPDICSSKIQSNDYRKSKHKVGIRRTWCILKNYKCILLNMNWKKGLIRKVI